MRISNHCPFTIPLKVPINYVSIFNPQKAVVKKLVVTNNSINQTLDFKELRNLHYAYEAEKKEKNSHQPTDKSTIKACTINPRILLTLCQLNHTPTDTITTLLFEKDSDKNASFLANFSVGHFANNHWLNTPGPIYTTQSNNNMTAGTLLATSNIASDNTDAQIIFKQPFTQKEVDAILLAAILNDGEGYYADGNKYWNKTNIINWWAKSEERIQCITEAYKTELFALINNKCAHNEPKQRPVPENYKRWLDFYRYEMKQYLQWYIYQLENIFVELPELRLDWSLIEKLDAILNAIFYQI